MLFEVGAVAMGIGILLSALIRQRARSAGFKATAIRLKFKYLGTTLPGALDLTGTEVANLSSVWNVIDGERDDIRVIAFDCRVGTGKSSFRRTVIAAPTGATIFAGRSTHLDLQRAGEWALLLEPRSVTLMPRSFMPLAELNVYIERI